MLGQIGSRWMDRLHQQLAKELRVSGWSQMDIAKVPRYNAEHGLTANHETRHGAWRIGR